MNTLEDLIRLELSNDKVYLHLKKRIEDDCANYDQKNSNSNQERRNVSSKIFHNYILIDPRKLTSDQKITFDMFLAALFYIGKAEGINSFEHIMNGSQKVRNKIQEIWNSGRGFIIWYGFEYNTSSESLARKATMIDAIRVFNSGLLLNAEEQSMYDDFSQEWSSFDKQLFGVRLLHKAFVSFLINDKVEITDKDL